MIFGIINWMLSRLIRIIMILSLWIYVIHQYGEASMWNVIAKCEFGYFNKNSKYENRLIYNRNDKIRYERILLNLKKTSSGDRTLSALISLSLFFSFIGTFLWTDFILIQISKENKTKNFSSSFECQEKGPPNKINTHAILFVYHISIIPIRYFLPRLLLFIQIEWLAFFYSS